MHTHKAICSSWQPQGRELALELPPFLVAPLWLNHKSPR